jgi:hypothetical protein
MGPGASPTQDELEHSSLEFDQRRGGLGSADGLLSSFPAHGRSRCEKGSIDVVSTKRKYHSSNNMNSVFR